MLLHRLHIRTIDEHQGRFTSSYADFLSDHDISSLLRKCTSQLHLNLLDWSKDIILTAASSTSCVLSTWSVYPSYTPFLTRKGSIYGEGPFPGYALTPLLQHINRTFIQRNTHTRFRPQPYAYSPPPQALRCLFE